jgi:hypothetical protein
MLFRHISTFISTVPAQVRLVVAHNTPPGASDGTAETVALRVET